MPNTVTYLNPFMQSFSKLFDVIKDFTYFGVFIHEALGSTTIIGINAMSPSYYRKEHTMQEIQKEISEQNLPLELIDSNPMETFFKLMIKK